MLAAQQWQGPALSEATGQPLTHDILSALGLLEKKHDGSDETIPFEEDCEKLQARMISEGAVLTKRRGSFSSDSDHSHRAHSSSHSTPVLSKPQLFKDNFSFQTSPPPKSRSPASKQQRKTYPPATQSPLRQTAPITNNDPQLYQPEWSFPGQTLSNPEESMKADFPLKSGFLSQNAFDLSDFPSQNTMMDSPMNQDFDFGDLSYPQMSNGFGGPMQDFGYGGYDPMMGMDVDFKSFITTA